MKLPNGLFGKNKSRFRAERDEGESGGVYRSEIISFLNSELERRRAERRPLELQWTLNSNFLSGHQYCGINASRGEIEDASDEGGSMRGVYNRISPLIETRLANLRGMSCEMTVRPRTNESEDFEKAAVATRVLRSYMSASEFDLRRNLLLSWSELCGSAFVISWWDKGLGEVIGRSYKDRGDGTREYEDICEGDLAYGLLTPYEVYPESVYKQEISDQRSIIIEQVMSAEDVYDLYGVRVDGGDVNTFALSPTGASGGFGGAFALRYRSAKDSVKVVTYFERAGKKYPRGRLIIACGDILLHVGDLPYDEIPLVSFKSKDAPGLFFGRSVIQELIPLQRAYNGCKNKIHDYIQTVAANPLLLPEGSVEDVDELADSGITPSSIIEYNAERGTPSLLRYSALPSDVSEEASRLVSEMEYTAGVSQLMVTGSTPSGITSGAAIERLIQIDKTRLALTGDNIRNAVRRLAVVWLGIYKRYASGFRIASIVGTNDVSGIVTWCSEDINSFDIEFDAENELKSSPEEQKAAFNEAMSLGLFNDADDKLPLGFRKRALEYMKLGRYADLLSESELQLQNARRENTLFEGGVIPKIKPLDDDELHIDEHRRYALQTRFTVLERKSREMTNAFYSHIEEHQKRLKEKGDFIAEERKEQ